MAQTRKQVRRQQQAQFQARNAAARAETARADRRRRLVRGTAIGVAVAAVAAGVAVPLLTGHHSAKAALPHPSSAGRTDSPPWAPPAHPLAAAQAAGLRVNGMEGTAQHYHAHLDIFVDGKPVSVPGNLGIDTTAGKLAELHTHDATGVLHVEAPDTKHRFVLGQLFAEWDVRLDASHLGGLTAAQGGKTLTAYVNGSRVAGDPGQIELEPHEEIALVYGTAGSVPQIPKSYTFPEGE